MGTVTRLRKPVRPAFAGPVRPLPPDDVLQTADGPPKEVFAPAVGIAEWVEYHLLSEGSPLFNPEHAHLKDAIDPESPTLVFMWAATGYEKQGRHVLGTAEKVAFGSNGFKRMRAERQMLEWFGFIPDFIITLAADYCQDASDTEFAGLLEHELYHIKHDTDELGNPKFDRETGNPKLAMRAHDVEEFVGVVRRYGIPSSGALRDLVNAANAKPAVAPSDLARSCGNCLEKAA